jgi:PhnB protein
MMSDENPDFGNVSPTTLGDTAVRFSLEVDDTDAVASRAVEAGAELVIPVEDQFYGYRSGRLVDPFGHIRILSQKLEDLSEEEMQSRCDDLFSS